MLVVTGVAAPVGEVEDGAARRARRRRGAHRRRRRGRAPRRPTPPPCATAPGWRPRRRASARGEVAHPLEAGEVGHEELAAPQRAVGAVAEAVEREAEHRRACGRARPCTRPRGRGGAAPPSVGRSSSTASLRRQVLGVQVVGDDLGRDPVEVGRGGRWPAGTSGRWRGAPGRRCGGSARRSRPWPRDRALQLGAHGQHLARRRRTAAGGARARSPASGAAAAAAPGAGPHHRVVAADVDGPVVGEQAVDERPEPARRRRRRRGRSARRSGCRSSCTSGRPTPASEQVVQRAVGQEQPSSGSPGATASATGRAGAAGRQHDRAGAARRGPRRRRRRARTAASAAARSATITANGLSSRCLAAAQLGRRPRRRWRRRRGGSRRCP